MKPILLLNHSFLEGIAHRSVPEARSPIIDLGETLVRARRLRSGTALHVHSTLAETDVGGGLTFVAWGNQNQRTRNWGDLLGVLLSLLSGPFVELLEVDGGECPSTSEPPCSHAPEWLRETLFYAAHAQLSSGGESWLLSYGERPYLEARLYKCTGGDRSTVLANFRSDREASEAEAKRSAVAQRSMADVLEDAARHAQRVVLLESARRSAREWKFDCSAESLYTAVVGLDALAAALEGGATREKAAGAYQDAYGIEMSQEKANTMKKPTLRAQRTFSLPDGRKELFDLHAKPGAMTRIHVFPHRDGDRVTIYIGWCGKHHDLK
jgi:hypothetical protein